MALEIEFDSVALDEDNDSGELKAYYDALADLPDRGDSVAITGTNGTWYADSVNTRPYAPCPYAVITVRRAGRFWTWTGLDPVERYTEYDITAASQPDGTSGLTAGYHNWFTNWPAASSWGPGDAQADLGALTAWEVEFVSATDYSDTWRGKKNGTWAAVTPPVAGAGIYYCRSIIAKPETYALRDGTTATVYRHFAVFWEAPIVSATRMTWNRTAW